MKYPALPLVVQRNIEQQKSWEGISTPFELAQYLARIMSIDPNELLQLNEIVYSDVEPVGDEARKIWVKTDEPFGIGVPVGNAYRMIYQYPPNVPFLFIGEMPTYARELTTDEMSIYSLTKPTSTTAHWIIYEI
jgi:hypothetical protein